MRREPRAVGQIQGFQACQTRMDVHEIRALRRHVEEIAVPQTKDFHASWKVFDEYARAVDHVAFDDKRFQIGRLLSQGEHTVESPRRLLGGIRVAQSADRSSSGEERRRRLQAARNRKLRRQVEDTRAEIANSPECLRESPIVRSQIWRMQKCYADDEQVYAPLYLRSRMISYLDSLRLKLLKMAEWPKAPELINLSRVRE
ncbi:unnamed protein product [Nesidiocoris tenuis]|uniref:Uncharacterized protein n=1 Tax=Nesidiocoris tenuis TaxID=355587 RepID=A0A6H5HQM4_9HEMI|nr:unnamed protein product [Nesidiocoris tenuis]